MLIKKHAIALICLLLVIFVCSNIDYKESKSDDFNITIIEEHKEEITDSTLHEEKINIFSLEKVFSNESRDDIIGAGYKPCGRCELYFA